MPDFSQITNNIFIGDVYSAIGKFRTYESDLLDVLNIQVVISILSEDEYEYYMISKNDFPNYEWHNLVLEDDDGENIYQYFLDIHYIINQALHQNKNIIIHCAGGISRSPTLVISYLMIENNWTFEEAYNYVKKIRTYISPNKGFINQLKSLEYNLKCNKK
jgi:protein-tyrosine phosphatase